ncbi:MAG: AAA family ATPase [Candidatus Bathyarchaeota archaeon]|nr:AAA family ATPase [Candidatus Bathyarchaeota archaeon]
MKIIVSMGRGGTGKTSFVALMAKYFIESNKTPILLIDADPDQSLADVLGVDFESEGRKTISELIVETFLEGGGTTVGVPPSERIESKIWEKGLYEGEFFDLISIGPKWVEGCYCLPNEALKGALGKITRNYRYVIIDTPAGLEHLNRRITSHVNDIFDLIDPSKKSLDHVARAYRIAREVNIKFDNFYVVGGYRFPENLGVEVERRLNLKFIGKIQSDENVERFILSGKSLLEIPRDSSAYRSVMDIMFKAGY